MGVVAGLFASRDEAQRAVEALRRAGFRPEEISILSRHQDDLTDESASAGMGESAALGALGGGVLGGLTGLVVGLGVLTIPGLGPVLAAGPLASVVAGSALGVGTGGLLGSFVDLGVSEQEARRLHEGIERGGVLVTVHAPPGREAEAQAVLGPNAAAPSAEPPLTERALDPRYDDDRDDWARGPDPATPADTGAHEPPITESDGLVLAGGATGSVIGGVIGAFVGGPLGAAAGVALGALAGSATGAAYEYSVVEPELRDVWEKSELRDQITWDRATGAFRYGWESHDQPELQASHWDQAKPALERHWPAETSWHEHEPLVRLGWQYRKARASGVGETAEKLGTTNPPSPRP